LAAAVFRDFAEVPRRQRNFLRMLFLDPQVRGRYADWPPTARMCVGFVRGALDGSGEPHLAPLIGELSLQDADFRTWWAERNPSYQASGTKTLTHPDTGRYTLDWQMLRTLDDSQLLMVMTAPPGSSSLEILRKLATEPSCS
jgi:UDP:flavonoid glycosyltransferase YjiC (YdhE family)